MMKNIFMRLAVAVSFAAMIVVNYLANALPINGKGTGELSDLYPSLFTPAGYTFSIWGVIYLALAVYVLFRLGAFRKASDVETEQALARIDGLFILSAVANICWILAWHYLAVGLSVVIMVVLLLTLITITRVVRAHPLSDRSAKFIIIPFSLYLAWIMVATIANVSALLISLRWDGFGISEVTWTVITLLIGLAIGLAATVKDACPEYGFVLTWAYSGILVKHLSADGFAGAYPAIITTTAMCIGVFVLGTAFAIYKKTRKGARA